MGKQIQVIIRATGKHHMEGILPSEFVETCDLYQAYGHKHIQVGIVLYFMMTFLLLLCPK